MKLPQNLNGLGILAGVASLFYAAYLHMKVNKADTVLGQAIDEVAKSTPVNVSRDIVDKAVSAAVEREVTKAVWTATDQVVNGLKADIRRDVKKAIDEADTNIRESVSEEISKQVALIDIDRLKRDVRDKAKEKVLEKFEGSLDGLLEDFNQNLQDVKKIYGSIANTLGKREETTIKIGG